MQARTRARRARGRGRGESRPRAFSESGVSLSSRRAPIVQPSGRVPKTAAWLALHAQRNGSAGLSVPISAFRSRSCWAVIDANCANRTVPWAGAPTRSSRSCRDSFRPGCLETGWSWGGLAVWGERSEGALEFAAGLSPAASSAVSSGSEAFALAWRATASTNSCRLLTCSGSSISSSFTMIWSPDFLARASTSP
jgi:hypothetical protein